MIRRAWDAWVRLMDRREAPTALALVRIGIAVVMLTDLLWTAGLGVVGALWSPPPAGYAFPVTGWPTWLGLDGPALWLIAVIALVAIGIGVATRVACVVFVLVSAKLSAIAPYSESAIDMMFRIVVLILALSRCNARWSVDAWIARRRGTPMPAEVPAWPRYLILLQVVWMYFSGGQNKSAAGWGPTGGFTALADALADPHAARFDPGWLIAVYPVTRLATLATMAFELGAPLYLLALYYADTAERSGKLRAWSNRLRLRWVWLALGISFEVGIGLLLRLGAFPWGMLALYPALLLPRDLSRRR